MLPPKARLTLRGNYKSTKRTGSTATPLHRRPAVSEVPRNVGWRGGVGLSCGGRRRSWWPLSDGGPLAGDSSTRSGRVVKEQRSAACRPHGVGVNRYRAGCGPPGSTRGSHTIPGRSARHVLPGADSAACRGVRSPVPTGSTDKEKGPIISDRRWLKIGRAHV